MFLLDVYASARSSQLLSRAHRMVSRVAAQEPWAQSLSADSLKEAFWSLSPKLPDADIVKGFALVREAAHRSLGLRPYDEQMLGGVVLLRNMLAEMQTGEGKTLTIVAPAALHALAKKGVHVVTANSYLAQRDAELMRPVYEILGLTVASLRANSSVEQRQDAYACDITYGVGSDFGFDYLKDNLVKCAEDKVQKRGLHVAIVDEVDSILIDEARVPLIISDKAAQVSEVVEVLNACVSGLREGTHYKVNLKERQAELTDEGYDLVENALVAAGAMPETGALYKVANLHWARRLHSAVRAYALFKRNRDYVVDAGEIVLVDTGTGRKMPGRRLEDGLHEALEAREGLQVNEGTVTRATVTYQNFFGMYPCLSGLTGTAFTEAEEFAEVYNLETVRIPTHRPCRRKLNEDLVYVSKRSKFEAVVAEIARRHASGQPLLVGCSTIRDADVVSKLLNHAGLAHELLTARQVEREADIIAQAGRLGAITVATNMAGRGTDIHLGGEKPERHQFEDEAAFTKASQDWAKARAQVAALGGLAVLGTERNGVRRVDNQLAGRSARQGDPGEVQFYMSLEDELLGVFGQSRQLRLARKALEQSGGALGGTLVTKLVTQAQKNVESSGCAERKQLLQFDQVLSSQRKAVYSLRDSLLEGDAAISYLQASVMQALQAWVATHMPADSLPETWPLAEMRESLLVEFGVKAPLLRWVEVEDLEASEIIKRLTELVAKEGLAYLPADVTQCRELALEAIDDMWSEHLQALDELRNNVSLKTKTSSNPLHQFGKDAYALFQDFDRSIALSLAQYLLKEQVRAERLHAKQNANDQQAAHQKVALALEKRWVYRNEPCPCGSGKRYRQCHGVVKA